MKTNNNKTGEDTKKSIFKKWWFWVLVIGIIVINMSNQPATKTSVPSSTPKPTIAPSPSAIPTTPVETAPPKFKTLEEEVTYTLGKEISKDTIKKVHLDEADSDLSIALEMSDNLTADMTKLGIQSSAVNVFKTIYPIIKDNPKVNMITYCSETEFVDTYGNTSTDNACMISMTKETLGKINWDNFQKDNLETLATSYFMHPSLNK